MTQGCFDFRAGRVGDGIVMDVDRLGIGVRASTHRIGRDGWGVVGRIDDGIEMSAARLRHPLRINVGLVCSLAKAKAYLRTDKDTVWLTMDNDFLDNILIWSNVEWKIL